VPNVHVGYWVSGEILQTTYLDLTIATTLIRSSS